MVRPRNIALIYLIFAGLAVLLLATTTPPMQNPDESAHAFRADQISRLGLIGQSLPDGQFGGTIDSGLETQTLRMAALPFHPDAKVTREMYVALPWGVTFAAGFPNTALYPPFFYLPAAAVAAIARRIDIPLPHALVLMRIASGLAAVAISALAIAAAGNAAIWFFAVLMLPMSLAVDAAITQDGVMLACVALAVALLIRSRRPLARARRSWFVVMCVLLTWAGMARPPYAALALLALAAPVPARWQRIGLAGIIAGTLAWGLLNVGHIVLPVLPEGPVKPFAQLLGLALHPLGWWQIAKNSWQSGNGLIARSFIGVLGWLDVVLPDYYDRLAWAVLGVAALAAWCGGSGVGSARSLLWAALAFLGAILGVAVIQYMTWTPVGATMISGIQGRYFLAPALLPGLMLARPLVAFRWSAGLLAAPVLLLPVITIAVVMHQLIIRYYF